MQFSPIPAKQAGFSIRLASIGIALIGGIVGLGIWLFSSQPIAACVEDASGSPPQPDLFAQALASCVQPVVATAETPAEASEMIYEFLTALDAVDVFGPLVVGNWQQTPDALKGRAFQAVVSRIAPYLRNEIMTTIHGTGTDQRGDFVHASYRAADGSGQRGTTLRLYLADGPYGFRITHAEFAPVN
jgi:hypothetical protein